MSWLGRLSVPRPRTRRPGRVGWLRWGLRIGLALLVVDLLYVATIWPNWQRLAYGPIPMSAFMKTYVKERAKNHWPRLRWQPVPYSQISPNMVRAAIVGEDSRFYEHDGIDWIAIRDALETDIREGHLELGGSTISQQTVKNLFLSPARDPVRKWHELLLTLAMEHHLSKRRIMEIYLNVAEFGEGIYGVEAAAQAYWGEPASDLSLAQAAELAASLPNPKRDNPASRTRPFVRRADRILAHMAGDYARVPPPWILSEALPPARPR